MRRPRLELSVAAARAWAAVAAGAVGLLALGTVVYPGVRDLSLDADVYRRRPVVVTVTETGPDGETVTRTEAPADDSAIERALGDSGLLLVRLGVAAAASFLAGAVVQRILLGRYGFEAAGIKLDDVAGTALASSEEAISALTEEVRQQRAALAATMRTAAEALRVAAEATRRLDDATRPRRRAAER